MPVTSLVEGSLVNPDLTVRETYDVTYQVPNTATVLTFSVPKVDDFYPLIAAEVERLTGEVASVFALP
jgi:hypothetical protein